MKPFEEFHHCSHPRRFELDSIFLRKTLHQVHVGHEANLKLASADESKLPSSIKSISKTPVLPGTYDLTADIMIPRGFLPPVPGSACTLECVTYLRKDAITLPSSVIHSETDDAESKYIYILNKQGKSQKKSIEVGRKSGDVVEILSGIRMGIKVMKEKPSN